MDDFLLRVGWFLQRAGKFCQYSALPAHDGKVILLIDDVGSLYPEFQRDVLKMLEYAEEDMVFLSIHEVNDLAKIKMLVSCKFQSIFHKKQYSG